jgi:hypothetical protein
MPRRKRCAGRIRLIALLTSVSIISAAGAAAAAAESFGPLPAPDQSRCAPLRANRKVLAIGQLIILRAGPITDQCGGPASTTAYAWQTTDPAQPSAAIGLVQVHPCPKDASGCVYRARLFTQPKLWQSLSILGESPFGGWSSSVPYVVRYGDYFGVTVEIDDASGQPKVVRLSGHGRTDSTTASESGGFAFAVVAGTYTFTYSVKAKTFHRTIHLKEPPGRTVELMIGAHYLRID